MAQLHEIGVFGNDLSHAYTQNESNEQVDGLFPNMHRISNWAIPQNLSQAVLFQSLQDLMLECL